MAELVGVKIFQKFLLQVRDLMEDDGIFYLQIAGLRRSWQWEDLIWYVCAGVGLLAGDRWGPASLFGHLQFV